MKRAEVLKKLRRQAKQAGLEYSEVELKNHTGVKIGNTKSTIGRQVRFQTEPPRRFLISSLTNSERGGGDEPLHSSGNP